MLLDESGSGGTVAFILSRRFGCAELLAGLLFFGGAAALLVHGLLALLRKTAVAQVGGEAPLRRLPVPLDGGAAQAYGIAAIVAAMAIALLGVAFLHPDESMGKPWLYRAVALLVLALILFLGAILSRI
jgi:hypothetical protein